MAERQLNRNAGILRRNRLVPILTDSLLEQARRAVPAMTCGCRMTGAFHRG